MVLQRALLLVFQTSKPVRSIRLLLLTEPLQPLPVIARQPSQVDCTALDATHSARCHPRWATIGTASRLASILSSVGPHAGR